MGTEDQQSAKAAGIAFVGDGVIFLVLNFQESGFEIRISRDGKFDPHLR